jgi:hypothetical protein|tara:strand:+ start:207 stop:419 length:213 start_codon:yes stop_codon:yes gene_type:complete
MRFFFNIKGKFVLVGAFLKEKNLFLVVIFVGKNYFYGLIKEAKWQVNCIVICNQIRTYLGKRVHMNRIVK